MLDRNFWTSDIDLCIYYTKQAIAIIYVNDVIIIGKDEKITNVIVESLVNGEENFDLTDKGSLDKYLGIEIKDVGNNVYELM